MSRTGQAAAIPSVTLSTYTYNDANLVHGLLESVREWSLKPTEIIVTDDGSRVPFTLEQTPDLSLPPVRIQRLPHNRGFAAAKQAGIDAALGDIVLSADCDARLHPDYLRRCLDHLADTSVGMVSGSCLVNAGEGSLGRYMRLFGDNYLARETGEVEFIPGVAFALRKEVWDEVNGFAGHGRATCEDHALCAKLKAKGYRLVMDHAVRAFQTRRLSRQAQCRRLWLWCGPALLAGTDEAGTLPDQFMAWYVIPLLTRIRICIERDCPDCIYHDLLHVTHAAFAVCRELGQSGRIPPQASPRSLLAVLEQRFSAYPLLWNVLKKDWIELGVLPLAGDVRPAGADSPLHPETEPAARTSPLWKSGENWAEPFAFLELLASSGVLSSLNDREVPQMLAEDERLPTDFSSYHPVVKE